MKKHLIVILSLLVCFQLCYSQETYVQKGEFGITAGLSHYFGDLNPTGKIDHPHQVFGVYYRKQFTNYTAIRIAGHYALLGYSDKYNSNQFMNRRNLSFNTDIFEFTVQGDFNFFRFNPNEEDENFTPYLTFGAGVFSFDPYAFYHGQKVYLRPLHTEGQGSYQGRKEYSTTAFCFPLGMGLKYCLSKKINLSFEVTHRFTNTDYIDDVSTTYIGASRFPSNSDGTASLAKILQDRSTETGSPIGTEGKQRGWSKQKDQYLFAEFGLSLNLTEYACPPSR